MELSRYGAITSVVVSRGGEIVTEQYAEGDADTLRKTRSCTKTVTGMLTGIAIERGIVPGVETTILGLLGADDIDRRNRNSPGNEELMYPQDDWVGFALGLPVREQRGFSYCTAGVVLLGVALERAVDEPLSEFARHELLAPLEIVEARWPRTPPGEVSTAGGLLLTSRSLLALGELPARG
jgi:CubicO group peptidase (beta-lactamase class C family)